MRKPLNKVAALQAMPLLADLPHGDLEYLAKRATEEHYRIGEELIRQGTSGSSAYFIARGSCEVRRKRGGVNRRLATLRQGEFFGELAIISPAPRMASITALEDTTVVVLNNYDFLAALRSHRSMALHLVKILAERLRRQESELA